MWEYNDVIVVDAANVIGSRPDGWWRDRAAATRRMLAALARSPIVEHHTVVVVVEGAAKAALTDETSQEFGQLRVVKAPGSGDDTIVDLVATTTTHTHSITVVTADRELGRRVSEHGAHTLGPTWLLNQL